MIWHLVLRICFEIYVSFSGSTHGLRLILNVEQYEYMRGPQGDVGAKE